MSSSVLAQHLRASACTKLVLSLSLVLSSACGDSNTSSNDSTPHPDSGQPEQGDMDAGSGDAGSGDAGATHHEDASPDGNEHDAAQSDAGAGAGDAGADAGPSADSDAGPGNCASIFGPWVLTVSKVVQTGADCMAGGDCGYASFDACTQMNVVTGVAGQGPNDLKWTTDAPATTGEFTGSIRSGAFTTVNSMSSQSTFNGTISDACALAGTLIYVDPMVDCTATLTVAGTPKGP